ncbi:MFS transporter [Erythrobacter sp. SG61-1L]|uniref:NnrU family protein n=1 Tax=Erythrobacter sp. SG61-1L TaxID=1603897 RepID=UPI0006C8F642|nr:NnrU family protein [Erythrobacter sp. SG61-1L]KPL69160.1 MFS transporter [Erythrobacter sp. SG61-1L]
MDPSLVSLIAASTAFTGGHFVLSHPLRAPLVRALGEKPFLGLYSLVAFASLIWMVLAFRASPVGSGGLPGLPGELLWAVASLLTLVALVLLFGSFRGNPAMPETPVEKIAAARPTGVFAVTRHPMMWGIALWAIAHILIGWSARTTILATAILILALIGSRLQDKKKAELLGDAWIHWEARSSFWPRWGKLTSAGLPLWLISLVLWLVATYGHIHAAGIPAGIWRWI